VKGEGRGKKSVNIKDARARARAPITGVSLSERHDTIFISRDRKILQSPGRDFYRRDGPSLLSFPPLPPSWESLRGEEQREREKEFPEPPETRARSRSIARSSVARRAPIPAISITLAISRAGSSIVRCPGRTDGRTFRRGRHIVVRRNKWRDGGVQGCRYAAGGTARVTVRRYTGRVH